MFLLLHFYKIWLHAVYNDPEHLINHAFLLDHILILFPTPTVEKFSFSYVNSISILGGTAAVLILPSHNFCNWRSWISAVTTSSSKSTPTGNGRDPRQAVCPPPSYSAPMESFRELHSYKDRVLTHSFNLSHMNLSIHPPTDHSYLYYILQCSHLLLNHPHYHKVLNH